MKEINEKLDEIQKCIMEAQAVAEKANQRLDAFDKEQIKKINDNVTALIQEQNDIKAKQAAVEKAQEEAIKNRETLEKLICRLPNAANSKSEDDVKMKNEFIAYMRKNIPLSDECVNKTCEDVISKSFFGLNEAEKQLYVKAMREGSNPDGGYWIRPELSATIVSRNFETSPVRQIANVETIGSESLELIIDDDQVAADWVGEVGARSETSTAKIGKLEIHAHELAASPKITQRLLDDAGFDLESWLAKKVSDKFSRSENTAFVTGDGAAKPKGFLSYPAWATAGTYERGKLEQINSGAAATFTGDGVVKLQNSLQEVYQPGSVFGIKRASFEAILTLKDGNDRYLLLQNGDLRSAPDKLLLGAPVIFMDDMPAIAANALAMVYGNFKLGYTVVDRVGIRVLRDPYTAKPYVLYYTTKRVGGAVTNYESIKIQKLAV